MICSKRPGLARLEVGRIMVSKQGTGWLAALLFFLVTALSAEGHAESTEASKDGKGTVGGALLGAEAVLLTEAAFGLDSPTLYLVGGAAGALGGGLVGHELEPKLIVKANMFMLAGGMLLVIPTIVAVLSATAYEADLTTTGEPPAEPTPASRSRVRSPAGLALRAPGAGSPERSLPRLSPAERLASTSLLSSTPSRGLSLGVPRISVAEHRPTTPYPRLRHAGRTEVEIAVLGVAF